MRELANALTTPGGTLWDGNAEKTSETLRFRPQLFSIKLMVLQGLLPGGYLELAKGLEPPTL
jgi:hypothetical protein